MKNANCKVQIANWGGIGRVSGGIGGWGINQKWHPPEADKNQKSNRRTADTRRCTQIKNKNGRSQKQNSVFVGWRLLVNSLYI